MTSEEVEVEVEDDEEEEEHAETRKCQTTSQHSETMLKANSPCI